MLPIETMLGKLGSRFTIHFPRTSDKCIYLSPLGKYYDRKWDLRLGLQATKLNQDGTPSDEIITRMLPYTATGPYFPEVEQEFTMTSVKWRARDRALGFRAEFTITAPFYPRDIKLSTAPFFYIEAEIFAPGNYSIELIVGLSDPTQETSVGFSESWPDLGWWYSADYKMVAGHWGPRNPTDSLSNSRVFRNTVSLTYLSPTEPLSELNAIDESGPEADLRIQGSRHVSAKFVLATYLPDAVLEVQNQPYQFKYLDYFKSLDSVLQYARDSEEEIRRKSALFDSLFSQSSLDYATRNLIAFSFQSYIPNSWWCSPVGGGKDWYSVWEGNCAFHSTVDVEYNLAWFYLLLWPELLEMTLSEWRNYLKPAEDGAAWMSHDIGGLLGANEQAYPHEMEVEESANFILLAYALWRYTARPQIVSDNAETIIKLGRYILASATTESGFPTIGTANTVDDASPAVQFGREQIYLAVKALSALHAAVHLLILTDAPAALIQEFEARVNQICQALDEKAWLGDHYAVCLDQTTDGLINPWSGEPLPPGELEGWNAYTLYTSNGLLYLLATLAPLPPLKIERFEQDIIESRKASLIEYGCTHSSADHSHIWVSQNLHRDLIGGFLGVDPADLPGRYWAFEQYENSVGRGGCFVDTYGPNHLRYYPRGITSLGLLAGLPGARFDRVAGRLELSPTRLPLRVPLLALADWANERVPWVEFSLEQGQPTRKFSEAELVEPFLKD